MYFYSSLFYAIEIFSLAAGGRRQWSAAVGKSGCRRLSTSEGGQAGGKQSAGTSQYSTDTQPGGGMKILGRMA